MSTLSIFALLSLLAVSHCSIVSHNVNNDNNNNNVNNVINNNNNDNIKNNNNNNNVDEPFPNASADRVVHLPGYTGSKTDFGYSGYLSAQGEKKLHYWFVPSQGDWTKDPLLLWVNGGPGCSSMDGFLSEHGPFHPDPTGTKLHDNPYAWNKAASIIYLEAPAGVGYSYSPNRSDYTTNDITVARDNWTALEDFLTRLFPELQGNPFGVTGESYGGVYTPSLTHLILMMNAKIEASPKYNPNYNYKPNYKDDEVKDNKLDRFDVNDGVNGVKSGVDTGIKSGGGFDDIGDRNVNVNGNVNGNGIKSDRDVVVNNGMKSSGVERISWGEADDLMRSREALGVNATVAINIKFLGVGNGLSSYKLNDNGVIMAGYGHGIIGVQEWNGLVSACCAAGQDPTLHECSFHNPTDDTCLTRVSHAMELIYASGLNMYRLNGECLRTAPPVESSDSMSNIVSVRSSRKVRISEPEIARKSVSRYEMDMTNLFRNVPRKIREKAGLVGMNVPCIDSYAAQTWLNNEEVRAALHIVPSLPEWSICSGTVGANYHRNFTDMSDTYREIISMSNDLNIALYNGNDDSACPGLADEFFVSALNRKIVEPRKMFHVDGQVAGQVVKYDRITYVSVKGSGHMVPQDFPMGHPPAALYILENYILTSPPAQQ